MAKTLSVIGVGAFGEFMIPHLLPFFHVEAHEPLRDISPLCNRFCVTPVDFDRAARADIVLLAPPIQEIESVAKRMAGLARPGSLVIDVCSVKMEPARILAEFLPGHCDIVGTHPLFGPQTGAKGIAGLNISVCKVRGDRDQAVADFLARELRLNVIRTTPEDHDRELAVVQGLTHLLSKVIVEMNLPPVTQTTATFDKLRELVESVRYDSDQLFRAIENRNPFTADVKRNFFRSAERIEDFLARRDRGENS